MMKFYRTVLLASSVALLAAGCASGPQYKEMAGSIPTLTADHGRIYFLRSNSIVGAAIQPQIKLNGTAIGHSKPGGFFYIDEPAGQYTVSTQTETEKTVSFALDAGETKYVRTSVSLGLLVGRVVPSLEEPDSGAKEIEELKYTGGSDERDDVVRSDPNKL
ncbi:hypothetical protein R75461_07903 [Paraburkholderia nemoris]|uniref:DUF2846 domain-containing protein n=1 Tax=Paraburkholderia nemoris TaxID=2793076 RepID=UPI00190CFD07|nr:MULTISPECIES: DUF2846 domain-containing protein [Paraburkholderia]MBK3786655.1 DUF2846 domain-containing protein [Paraburkholderia aspalathi]CAE6859444.1 hypothetical protein R75461_07903 [Paraburkholderia nemoris]